MAMLVQGGAMKKKDGKRGAKEEAAQQAALRALANREAHWDTLERARLELESLRMLLERVGRREKVKKQREAPPPALHHNPGNALADRSGLSASGVH